VRSSSGAGSRLAQSRKPRRGTELLCEYVFRPLAHPVVLVLARLRVPPPVVVAASGAAGLAAAVELGRGSLVAAAVLVQLKTLLDNADGQLARVSGRTSAFGRYLDSEVDLLVNGALFAAVGWESGRPGLALLGFLALTTVLSLNFNAERLARGAEAELEGRGGRPTRVVRRLYAVVYAPQDELAERLAVRRPAYASPTSVRLLANLGLTTQLAAFGALAAIGHPLAFALVALAELVLLGLALLPQRLPPRQEEPA
jgi:phosphatidylglycerophosphate synthase